MKQALICLALIFLYLWLMGPFTVYMQQKPYAEKLGYVATPEVLQFVAADQSPIVSAGLVFKVLVYFGTLVEMAQNKIYLPPDYPGMFKLIQGALRLDPYNMDGYYFSQAILTWDVGRIKDANALLEYGMKYRTWDWYLPLFAGFNYGYFLKDYENAAKYYKKASELSGADLYTRLAARYMYESGNTAHAISYLSVMVKNARNEAIKKSFEVRLAALQGIYQIEQALEQWKESHSTPPDSVLHLQREGYLNDIPLDPYGGDFYIDADGMVKTTSQMSYAGAEKYKKQKAAESADNAQ